MPTNVLGTINDNIVEAFNPAAGTPAGSKQYAISPVTGRLLNAGIVVASACTSNLTLAVAIGAQLSSVASNFTQVISSTLAAFTGSNLLEGVNCSVAPTSPAYVNAGDVIQFTTSGGNTSAIGGTLFAVIRGR